MIDNSVFVVKYISEAVKNNRNALEDALQEIKEIDFELASKEPLKIRRMQLMHVVNHFGDHSLKKKRGSKNQPSSQIEIEENQELREKIRSIISLKGPINNRDLIVALQGADSDSTVIRTVKSMGMEEILDRDNNNLIIKGQKF